jgi:hypothetical protein
LQGDKIPQEVEIEYVVPIHKKWDESKCENFRIICITNSFIKIIGNILRKLMEIDYEETEEKSGFT